MDPPKAGRHSVVNPTWAVVLPALCEAGNADDLVTGDQDNSRGASVPPLP